MTEMMNPEEYRSQLLFGNCFDVLKRIPSNTVTAVVTDPPYGLSAQPDMREVLKHWLAGDDYEHTSSGFMGKEWDNFVPGPKIWEEVMRVLKPGGHILSFSGTRTYDLMVTAMRIAGAEVRDKIDYYCEQTSALAWVHGQGFPKSLDISKAMDKMGGQSISWFIDYCINHFTTHCFTIQRLHIWLVVHPDKKAHTVNISYIEAGVR